MSGDSARVSVMVAVPPPLAFQIFSADIDQWWRRGAKFRHSGQHGGLLRIEPVVGGRLFECFNQDGAASVIDVGRIKIWQPPTKLAFTWRNVNFAAGESTYVEVDFVPRAAGTLVTVTHSGWSSLRADHPARHGLDDAAFSRMIGLWWGELMNSLRLHCLTKS